MSDVGDKVELPVLDEGTVIEKIDKRDLKPLWEDHEHTFVDDPTDETDDYRAVVCTFENCGMGRLIRKA